jgi:hypothetical protein
MIKIAELDCCQIIILSIYVPSTHAYTHVLRISLDLPYENSFDSQLIGKVHLYIYLYIRLKIKPNSVRIRQQ